MIFDFTRRLLWPAGAFGDDGSCFWTDYDGARIAMMRAGIGAIRFYSPLTGRTTIMRGQGRAWFFPHEKHFVLFNAYGLMQARSIANFLGQLFGDYKYKSVHIAHTRYNTDGYTYTYRLYLNSDGYIIHNKPFKKRLSFPVLDGIIPRGGTNRWGRNNLPGEGDKWFDKE